MKLNNRFIIIVLLVLSIILLTACESAEEARHRRAVELESSRVQAANSERQAAQAQATAQVAEAERLRVQAEHDAAVVAAESKAAADGDVAVIRANTEAAERLAASRQAERDAALQRSMQIMPVLLGGLIVLVLVVLITFTALSIVRVRQHTAVSSNDMYWEPRLHHAQKLYTGVVEENRRLRVELANSRAQLSTSDNPRTIVVYNDEGR